MSYAHALSVCTRDAGRGAGAAGPGTLGRPAATAAALSPAGGEDIVCDGGVCVRTRAVQW